MTDERIIAYLLEELTEEESERFEDELFAADEWETDVQAVEDDLMDAYVRGELSPERARRFEEDFLHTEARRERLVLATAILRRVDELTPAHVAEPVGEHVPVSAPVLTAESTPARVQGVGWWSKLLSGLNAKPLAYRLAVALVVLILLAGAIWFVGFRGQRQQTLASLTLTLSNQTRGEGIKPEHIGLNGKDVLKLTLALPETASATAKFEAELFDGAGQSAPVGPVTREGSNIVVTIPANRLRPGTYVVKVSSVENEGAPAPFPGVYKFVVD
jgi:anti-sigma factor RsiW